jgi:hypothetical protein
MGQFNLVGRGKKQLVGIKHENSVVFLENLDNTPHPALRLLFAMRHFVLLAEEFSPASFRCLAVAFFTYEAMRGFPDRN